MSSVAQIHQHYVRNTVATFSMDVLSIEDHTANLEKVQSQTLPYLVAMSDDGDIKGFSYLSGFRGGKAGYRHTVELTLYCHPNHISQGIGSALLQKILEVMSEPEQHCGEFLQGRVRPVDRRVRQIMAVMAVDSESRDAGLGLKRYYEGFGFELQGHLKQMGHKLDRW